MKVIVCGGRDYADVDRVFAVLNAVDPSITLLVDGGCPTGADRAARRWARAHGILNYTYNANWRKFGNPAGPMRNSRMAADGADLLVAFPGENGTANMIAKARALGIPVQVVEP